MGILRGQEALGYLDRAISVFDANGHSFSQMLLVQKLLLTQRVFLDRLLNTGREGIAVVDIHPSGFPRLNSWYVDTIQAFDELDRLRVDRARVLLPFMQQLVDANDRGIKDAGREVAKTFEADYGLASNLSPMPTAQRRYLIELSRKGATDVPPIYYHKKLPGLLLVENTSNVFQARTYKEDWRNHFGSEDTRDFAGIESASGIAGLKFVDAKPSNQQAAIGQNLPRVPALLYVSINSNMETGTVSVATHRLPFEGQKNRKRRIDGSSLDLEADLGTILPMANAINGARPEVRELFLNLDLSEYDGDKLEKLIGSLPKINAVISAVLGFARGSDEGKAYTGTQVMDRTYKTASTLRHLLESLPDDALRADVQVAIATAIAPARELMKKQTLAIASRPSVKQIEAPADTPVTTGLNRNPSSVASTLQDQRNIKNLWGLLGRGNQKNN